MKKLLLLTSIFFTFHTSQATHMIGGEITWECLSNGEYVFYLKVYRDCSGLNTLFRNEIIYVLNNPLPRSANNTAISQIVMQPDSVSFLANNGDISTPQCLSCSRRDVGAFQEYNYISDTMQINGLPPSGGWDLYFESHCCRSGRIINFTQGGPVFLRANFNIDSMTTNANPCMNSSPKFIETPTYYHCRGQEVDLNFLAIDSDFDSISYHLDHPIIDSAFTMPTYRASFSPTSPTPDQSFDSSNIPFTLNSLTGQMNFKINNGVGIQFFTIVVRIDGWKNGVKNASIYREVPIAIYDCILDRMMNVNNRPDIIPPFNTANGLSYSDTFQAGSNISFPISVTDSNLVGQLVEVEFFGNYFSNDFTTSTNCTMPNISSCATLNPAPIFNAQRQKYLSSGRSSIITSFNWQTNCSMLGPGFSNKTYYFYVKAQDEHCLVRQTNYQVISITLEDGPNQPCQTLTAIDEASFQDALSVFPNPTNGQINIQSGLEGELNLKVLNIQGQLVQEEMLLTKNNQINLKGDKGIYFLILTDSKGQQANFKVVKQ